MKRVKKRADHPFLRALAGKISGTGFQTRRYRPIDSKMGMKSLMKESSRVAADLARQIDRTMMALMNDPRISDPELFAGQGQDIPDRGDSPFSRKRKA